MAAQGAPPKLADLSGVANGLDYSVTGDGVTDETAAIQAALNTFQNVYLPGYRRNGQIAQYVIAGQLNVPPGRVLSGPLAGWSAAPNNRYYGTSANPTSKFATKFALIDPATIPGLLRITGGAGTSGDPNNPEATAAITINSNATVQGFCCYYPNQPLVGRTGTPIAYPYTFAMPYGANATLRNIGAINPYQLLNINGMWRPLVENITAQAYYRGIRIDQNYDVARINTVHYETFWDAVDVPVGSQGFACPWQQANGIGFELLRCDLANMSSCFVYGMNVGMVCNTSSGTGSSLDGSPSNAPWLVAMNFGADGCNTALVMTATQAVPFGANFIGGTIDALLNGNPAIVVSGGLANFTAVQIIFGSLSQTGGETSFTGGQINGSSSITGGKFAAVGTSFVGTSNQLTLGSGVSRAMVVGCRFASSLGLTNNIATAANYTTANNMAW